MRLEDRRPPAPKQQPADETSLGRVQVDQIRLVATHDALQRERLGCDGGTGRAARRPGLVLCAGSGDVGGQGARRRASDDRLPPLSNLIGDERRDVVGHATGSRLRDVKNTGQHADTVARSPIRGG
jgi:hypothetical protein